MPSSHLPASSATLPWPEGVLDGAGPNRRTVVARMMQLTAALALTGCKPPQSAEAKAPPGWPDRTYAPVEAPRIGQDPDLINPSRPWPLTLRDEQRRTLAQLIDLILPADGSAPAPSAVGVTEFIDEWVSAPYESQHSDRILILPGLDWLDATSGPNGFAGLDAPAAQARVASLANTNPDGPEGLARQFFNRVRWLTLGGYYTTPEGQKDLGLPTPQAITGDWPGPSDAALSHLSGVLRQLGLEPA